MQKQDWRDDDTSYNYPAPEYDVPASQKAHKIAYVTDNVKAEYTPANITAKMRAVIAGLKPGNATDSQKELTNLLDRLIKEMQCR